MSAWRRPERGLIAPRKPPPRPQQSAEKIAAGKSSWSFVTAKWSTRRYDARQPAARCAAKFDFVWQSSGTYCSPKHARFHRGVLIGKPKTPPRLFRLQMAQRHRERVSGVRRLRCLVHRDQRTHHYLHLPLVGVAVTGDGSFHFARRVAVDHHTALRPGKQTYAAHFGQL